MEADDSPSISHLATPPKKKSKRMQKYRIEWEKDHPWLERVRIYNCIFIAFEGTYEGHPVQPVVTTTVQHTTVNILTEPPKDYVVWSIFNLVYSNPCCLGLAALISSIKARDRRVVGDLNGARHYASTARMLNISATVLVVLSVLIAIITHYCLYVRIT